jgi:hypothetical protein
MGGGGGGLVGGIVVWWPPPPPKVVGLVSRMYKMDGIFVWQIRVKTLGCGHWLEPVMVLEGIIEVKL